jgi:hypothetical protein
LTLAPCPCTLSLKYSGDNDSFICTRLRSQGEQRRDKLARQLHMLHGLPKKVE